MCEFKGNIPATPEDTNIIYSHPYQLPKYQLDDFEIDFSDFPVETNNNQILSEKKELEEKISKIHELIKFKTYEKSCQILKQMSEERSKMDEEIKPINDSIDELTNYTTDLCHILFNYKNTKLDALFDDLRKIIYQKELELTGDEADVRCDDIKQKLTSLKPETPRKKRKH